MAFQRGPAQVRGQRVLEKLLVILDEIRELEQLVFAVGDTFEFP